MLLDINWITSVPLIMISSSWPNKVRGHSRRSQRMSGIGREVGDTQQVAFVADGENLSSPRRRTA